MLSTHAARGRRFFLRMLERSRAQRDTRLYLYRATARRRMPCWPSALMISPRTPVSCATYGADLRVANIASSSTQIGPGMTQRDSAGAVGARR